MEHKTHPLSLDEVLVTVFRQVVADCAVAVGSVIFVSKKWNLLVRDQHVWRSHPLGIPLIAATATTISYEVLSYYMRPLILREVDAQLARLCQVKKDLSVRFSKAPKVTALAPNNDQWRELIMREIDSIDGVTDAVRHCVTLYFRAEVYYEYCAKNYVTPRQLAVMLVMTGHMQNFRSDCLFELWPGIKHLYKSHEQLTRECHVSTSIEHTAVTGSTSSSGLRKPSADLPQYVTQKYNRVFAKLVAKSFVLSSAGVYSCPRFATNYHTMDYGSWVTFLSQDKWVASFAFYESHEYDSFGCHFFVIHDNTTGKTQVINTKQHYQFDLNGFTEQLGDSIIKPMYELTDDEWAQIPRPKYNAVLNVLSGVSWDVFDMI